MHVVMPPNIDSIAGEVSFKKSIYGFPHKAKLSNNGAIELFIENRITVSLAFELRDVISNKCISESCFPVRPRFRLDVVHAKDESLVRETDFKTIPRSLIDSAKKFESMNGGKVVFTFKIGFLSSQSKLGGCYRFKLTCISPELCMHPLEVCTPSWRAVSRDIKRKDGR